MRKTDSDGDADSRYYCYRDGYGNTKSDCDTYCYAGCFSDRNTDADSYTYFDTETVTDAESCANA